MARYGYARVSSTDQDCSLQEARLRAEGCKVVRTEKASGKSRDGRDELARIMDFLHAGDELNLVHDLEAKGAALTVLEPTFSTKDAAGPILVTVLGMVAEMGRKFIRERQQAGSRPPRPRASTRGGSPLCRSIRSVRCGPLGRGRWPLPRPSGSAG